MEGSDRDAADAEDIRRVRAGQPGAFAGLVSRHARRVHDMARRMLRDAHEAEDVTQQAFLRAYGALERFDTSRPFRNWLLRIASNLCRNRLAARRVRRRLLAPTGGEDPPPEPAAPPPDLDLPADAGARRARIAAAVEALPERHRLAVILHHVHGLPVAAVAEIAGAPPATVKTWLHRGRAALRRLLAAPETSPPARGTEACDDAD
jgi:RNA polymerase sigma-70 factor (ECF subfamily)